MHSCEEDKRFVILPVDSKQLLTGFALASQANQVDPSAKTHLIGEKGSQWHLPDVFPKIPTGAFYFTQTIPK